jgi:calcineurin-like phosphoesterase family protein
MAERRALNPFMGVRFSHPEPNYDRERGATEMATIWFTGDTHFGHKNIINLCNRPFTGIRAHDEALIEKWNSRVEHEDTVYHLGDFGLSSPGYLTEIAYRLNGTKHLVYGNHDKPVKKSETLRAAFASVSDYQELKVGAELSPPTGLVVLMHYPIASWNKSHFGSIHCHGHSHGKFKTPPGVNRVDVGVDCWNYEPVNLTEIARFLHLVAPGPRVK